MINSQFWYPYFTWERPYRGEWVTELNVEWFELRKDGSIAFNHPSGTHDDVFWATCLALYATVEMTPEPEVWIPHMKYYLATLESSRNPNIDG